MSFEEIYHAYFQDVYLYIRSLTHDENIAEEITQEAFFKALKSIESFNGTKDIRAWLFTIARNTYFSYYKKKKWQMDSDVTDELSTGVTVLDYLISEEEAFIVHQFLHDMEEPYKEVFSLRTFGELPFDKIGKLFGKSASWARVTFYRAKNKIRAYMEANQNERH
ncbi:RNA polymerase subunit sigma [Bacillus pseudomycoides]|uniref:RNA polymerase sigma factor n=1 Tax=Bacillus pseudomycoides TaxID=64104 RepID=UPI000BEDC474|nr:RNA polymerase sigma factor [Bacillus pseudomycoides]PDZ08138.1 RNA polymerase subunit sigma [Bacillus pseudomycoides]PEK31777.1 RNA polymerase subunit sigma [Bacillus pseudomycoides]PEK63087.1 RNA polymerase subunit sigma [Bacillus pseudomycoides]PEO47000.1 RNA polymerase subunit sigma [Bacillus pseudomycoides]PEP34899.1 RNA polymerase subunit sigma [Bacillus pseudomycoides]